MAFPKPIAIPAIDPDAGSPFLRAYPPVLGYQYSLSKPQFLEFLDALNKVVVPNPPLQALSLVGTAVGFVPIAHAQLIGFAISSGVKMANPAVSAGATEMFLRKANTEIFGPRGLKVEIAHLDAVAKLAGMPILNQRGRIDKSAALLDPIEGLVGGDGGNMEEISAQQRRLNALKPWIAELEAEPFHEAQVPATFLGKLKAKAGDRKRRKAESKVLENREKAREYYERDYHKDIDKAREDYDKEMRKLDEKESEVRHKEAHDPRKLREEMSKIMEDRQKVEEKYHEEMGKVDEDRIGKDKEEESVRKILWVLIRPLNAPSGQGPNPVLVQSY